MNFIAKRLNIIGILLLAGFTATAAGLYFNLPARVQAQQTKSSDAKDHSCAMHAKPAPLTQAHEMGCCDSTEGKAAAPVEPASDQGCCGGSEAGSKMLPAGHPPVTGYVVQESPHASSDSR